MRSFLSVLTMLTIAAVFSAPATVLADNHTTSLMTDTNRQGVLTFLKDLPATMEIEISSLASDAVKNAGPVVGAGLRFGATKHNGQPVARVASVFPNSPAEKSGMQKDDLILSVNGKSFATREKLFDEFHKEVRGDGTAGRKVTFEVERAGSRLTMQVVTAVLRADKTEEAKKLQATITSEGAALKAKLLPAAADLAKSIEAGPVSKLDPSMIGFGKLMDEYDLWLVKKEQEIGKLLEVK